MADNDNKYHLLVGLTFLFNLLLGTGVLTMPAVFGAAGWLSALVVVTLLCAISYKEAGNLVESMANANFLVRTMPGLVTNGRAGLVSSNNPSINQQNGDAQDGVDNLAFHQDEEKKEKLDLEAETLGDRVEVNYGLTNTNRTLVDRLKPIGQYFEINNKYELGDMCELFLGPRWHKFFFASIIIYLLGDLMIYNTMMAVSTREVSCTAKVNCSLSAQEKRDAPCWDNLSITRGNMYKVYVLIFVSILLPLTYAQLKKTSSIQIITIVLRWLAFLAMVGITIKIFIKHEATGQPKMVDLSNVPKMFGICVYAFMCHHSVPSILTPIRNKRRLNRGLAIDYLLVFGLYVLVSFTAVFAFGSIASVYTLNFQINECPNDKTNSTNPGNVPVLDIFLPTYPIFTMFSSYTMIALSLINNMKVLAKNWCDITRPLLHYSFPLIAMVPPLIVATLTEDVSGVVSYVGSYAGGLIQYLFPCILVYRSRQQAKSRLMAFIREKYPDMDSNLTEDQLYQLANPYASPLQHNVFLLITVAWWVICLMLVTYDHIAVAIHK